MKAKTIAEIMKPWAVSFLSGEKRVWMERFSTRGDAEVYAFNLRKMVGGEVDVVWDGVDEK